MNFKKTITLVFFYLSMPSGILALHASGLADENQRFLIKQTKTHASPNSFFFIINPVELVLTLYDSFVKSEDQKIEETMWRLIDGSHTAWPDSQECKEAADFLRSCALEGQLSAMYHVGLLHTLQPDKRCIHLQKYFTSDPQLGQAYLRTCQEKNYQQATSALQKSRKAKEDADTLVTLMEATAPQDLSKALIYVLDKPVTEQDEVMRTIANARLSACVIQIPPLLSDSFERRKTALYLLHLAAQMQNKQAQQILARTQEQDNIYTEICRMMMDDKDKVILNTQEGPILSKDGDGLILGDAGWQEQYITILWKEQIKVLDRVLSQEDCELYKNAMRLRVMSLFHLYSEYLQSSNIVAGASSLDTLDDIGSKTTGSQIIRASICKNHMTGLRILNTFTMGVSSAFTVFEVMRAKGKLIDLGDDFDDQLSKPDIIPEEE